MQITDHHINAIAKGDIEAFKHFFDAFYPSLCKFCYGYLESYDGAADVAQESIIKFWNNRANHKGIKQAKVYIYTTARNNCLNVLRHEQVVKGYENSTKESDIFFTNAVVEEEVYELLYKAVDQLPDQTRNIIKLALEGLKNEHIAEQLGISINTVKSLKKNAYRSLRLALKDHIYALIVLFEALFG